MGHALIFPATTLQMCQCFRDSCHTAPYRHGPASGNQSGFGALVGIYQVWDVGQNPLTSWRLGSSCNNMDVGDALAECGVMCAKNMACNKCSVNSRISTSATLPGAEFLIMGHPSGPHSRFLGWISPIFAWFASSLHSGLCSNVTKRGGPKHLIELVNLFFILLSWFLSSS